MTGAGSTRSHRREVEFVTVHGHRRAFVRTGSGPALLLLHGLGCDHTTWDPVIDRLAKRFTVIAPDLLGHGASDKPRADYSVGGYANGMRDLLTVLGIDRVTVVGHSLGGGVAMQFTYQYPELVERLVLVAPGGFGPEVTPAIRMITAPGFHQLAAVATLPGLRHAGVAWLRALKKTGLTLTRDLDAVADIYDSFKDERTRAAIRHVVRAVVDWRGQVITMVDRAYLTEHMPICLIWGEDDLVIPASHAEHARRVAPGAQITLLPNCGHFPHRDHPDRFAKVLQDFVRTTPPAAYDAVMWRDALRTGGVELPHAEAGHAPRSLPSA